MWARVLAAPCQSGAADRPGPPRMRRLPRGSPDLDVTVTQLQRELTHERESKENLRIGEAIRARYALLSQNDPTPWVKAGGRTTALVTLPDARNLPLVGAFVTPFMTADPGLLQLVGETFTNRCKFCRTVD